MSEGAANARSRAGSQATGEATNNRVSEATVARLPRYLQPLVDAAADGVATVSSDHLAELAGVNSATLRRDLASFNITGTRGVGYDVKYLIHELNVALGLHNVWPVVIVGVGNLGRALMNYDGLEQRGFPVRALLDNAPEVIGTTIAGIRVEPIDDAAAAVAREEIAVAVIATPPAAAQAAADQMVAAGLRSLLNFTAQSIEVPDDVVVRRVDLATELQILSFYQQRSTGARTGVGVPLDRPAPGDGVVGTLSETADGAVAVGSSGASA